MPGGGGGLGLGRLGKTASSKSTPCRRTRRPSPWSCPYVAPSLPAAAAARGTCASRDGGSAFPRRVLLHSRDRMATPMAT